MFAPALSRCRNHRLGAVARGKEGAMPSSNSPVVDLERAALVARIERLEERLANIARFAGELAERLPPERPGLRLVEDEDG